jgi:hypothetical protein
LADTPAPAPQKTEGNTAVADAVKALDAMLDTAPAKADEAAPSVVRDEAGRFVKSEGAAVAKAEKDEAPEKEAPDAVQQQDLDWAPKNLWPKLSSLDKDTRDWLKDKVLLKSDYTKLRQKEKPELESLREDAEFARRLKAHPEAAAAAFRVLDGRKEEEKPPEDDFDLLLATPAERRAYLDRIAEEKASKIVEAKIRERIDAPQERVASVKSVLEAYIADEGHKPEVVMDALTKAAAVARMTGGEITARNVVDLVSQFVAKAAAAPTNGSAPKAEDEGLGKVASPKGRGSGAVPPPDIPAWKRESRGPKAGAETKSLAHETLKSLGFETTAQGLDALIESLR